MGGEEGCGFSFTPTYQTGSLPHPHPSTCVAWREGSGGARGTGRGTAKKIHLSPQHLPHYNGLQEHGSGGQGPLKTPPSGNGYEGGGPKAIHGVYRTAEKTITRGRSAGTLSPCRGSQQRSPPPLQATNTALQNRYYLQPGAPLTFYSAPDAGRKGSRFLFLRRSFEPPRCRVTGRKAPP